MLKGTATIELTDVKTGKKEVVKHDNLVTNAIQSALSTPFAYQYNKGDGNNAYMYAPNLIPLCPNLVGGILMYEDVLEEDATKCYAPQDNKLIGYSGNDANGTEDTMRGSMNQTESGPLEDGSGYRFVFDFATSQANGTISSVGLTSKWGGVGGFGSAHYKNVQSPFVYGYSADWSSTDETQFTKDEAVFLENIIAYDENTGKATSAYVYDQSSVFVGSMIINAKTWSLVGNMVPFSKPLLYDSAFLETKTFAGTTISSNSVSRNYAFCDGKDGYIWGFENAGNAEGNAEGKASINWIKIKIEDFSFEEGTWEIDAQLYRMGRRRRNFTVMHGGSTTNECRSDDSNAVITGGRLYCFNYGLTGLYSINLSNVTDVVFYEHPDKSALKVHYYYNSYYIGRSSLNLIGNTVCFTNGYLNKDVIVPVNYKTYQGEDVWPTYSALRDGYVQGINDNYHYPAGCHSGLAALQTGVFRMFIQGDGDGVQSSSITMKMYLMPPYLATINNLATPVQKTADKTMKITYILREETA